VAESAFGVQLRRSRQAAALSLRQLATRVGYDHSYLSQVERGQRPGSAHLAQLCDRELGTGPALTIAYEQTHPSLRPAAPAAPVRPPVELPSSRRAVGPATASAGDLLEAVRHDLAGSFGPEREVAEWRTVTAAYAEEFATTPPAELLPDLTADLRLLQSSSSGGSSDPGGRDSFGGAAGLAVPAAELAVLIALTLAALGRIRTEGRWWRTARATADSSAECGIGSLTRSWEATSGLSERRPLPQLLELAEGALAMADEPQQVARALAARARVLAAQGEAVEARQALQDLLAVAGELPVGPAGTSSLFAWSQYESCGVEGVVHAALGEPTAAYPALDRALSLCPAEWLRERAELELVVARCLVLEGDVAAGLAVAMRVLVELPDQWHTLPLYDAARRVLSAVRGEELGRAAVRDYRELLRRRPFDNRTVGSGSSSGWSQG
jgi:transcriptional regulator with XRE-family HTH domain/tetratricopeptide (TPR) repeat protein